MIYYCDDCEEIRDSDTDGFNMMNDKYLCDRCREKADSDVVEYEPLR